MIVADNARYEAYGTVGNDCGGQFSPRENIVAHGDFFGDEMVTHALVYTFIMTAENDHVLFQRKIVGHGLIILLTVRSGEDHLIVVALGLQRCDTAVDGLALHYHSRKTAVGIIVHPAPLVERIVAKVMEMDFGQPLLLGAGKNGTVDKALQHFGQHSDDVYSHNGFLFDCKGKQNNPQ